MDSRLACVTDSSSLCTLRGCTLSDAATLLLLILVVLLLFLVMTLVGMLHILLLLLMVFQIHFGGLVRTTIDTKHIVDLNLVLLGNCCTHVRMSAIGELGGRDIKHLARC